MSTTINSTKSPIPFAQTSPTSDESFASIHHDALSSSCSSISSNTSTISNDSSCTSLSEREMALHIMLYNSIEIISKRFSQTKIYCKFSGFAMDSIDETFDTAQDDDFNHHDGIDQYPFDVAAMNDLEYKFQNQNLFGRSMQTNEFIIVRCKIPLSGNIGIRVDLFQKMETNNNNDSNDIGHDVSFNKIAFGYIYPVNASESSGIFTVPITSKMGKIIAHFKAEYFITKPYNGMAMEPIKWKSKTRNIKSWQLKKNGYDIGHRGAGCARRIDSCEKVLENTIDSFNFAFKKGADMVELDVQLTKDKIPIVYHDFNVNIVLQQKDHMPENFQMNIKDLTYEQLQKLKLRPLQRHGKECYDFDGDDVDSPHGLPFASLQTVLKSVEANCGFNVEIKYPQKKINGDWEAEKSHDLNEYVDLILQDLFLYADDRKIIISSFHPEICSMVKLKQDRYPVLFLTQGLSTKWMKYHNPLNHSIEMAAYLALCMDLYGVAVHAEDIIKNSTLIRFVKSKSLVLFCWGDDLNDRELIKNLKKEGIDGAIYDKIDLLIAKPESHENPNCEVSPPISLNFN
ncbi:glycerophosphocholine phosphodiesterase gpcpd1-like protein [Dermatophagoides farinae]|uniref:Glycerophosphocholine phosphodiesterase gpcpd1-like protein n=1 Tax=Dermatophagoides farinae TaxID=6954 RepID=A0A9D4NYD9_DERFA|nr:glycerophosphocholine phosphodiesterase gpcpd1-like protein [Dermatophagoides farinae]